MIKVTVIDGSHKSNLYIEKSDIYSMVRYEEENKTVLFRKHDKSIKVLQTPEEILATPDIEPPKTIDWEQRRYDIAKEMLPVIYTDDNPKEGEDYLTLQQAANEAVRYADALIKELKKGDKK